LLSLFFLFVSVTHLEFPAAAVKLQRQRMEVSKFTMPEIRALTLFYLKTEILKRRQKGMVVRASCRAHGKITGLGSVGSAFHMAPPAVTEVYSDKDVEDDKKTRQQNL
jgi:hypothetical protein